MAYKRVKVTRYLEAALQGGSRSQYFAGEDGRTYLVKAKENPQGVRVLVNELVVNGIAQLLEAPCPEGVIIDMDQALLDVNPSLTGAFGRPISAGSHFGVTRAENVYRNLPSGSLRTLFAKVHNADSFPLIVMIDVLTLNHDRNNDGNFLLVRPDFAPSHFYFSMIDHGHCFGGPSWNHNLANQVGSWPASLLPEMVELIHGADPFRKALNQLKLLTDAAVDALVDGVPGEWGLAAQDATSLKSFLKGQRDRMESILTNNKHHFPRWN